MNRQRTQDYSGSKTTLCDAVKPAECATPAVISGVSRGLWVMLLCQCGLTHGNHRTTLDGAWESQGTQRNSLSALLIFAVNLTTS